MSEYDTITRMTSLHEACVIIVEIMLQFDNFET